jgi:hypothetical protein
MKRKNQCGAGIVATLRVRPPPEVPDAIGELAVEDQRRRNDISWRGWTSHRGDARGVPRCRVRAPRTHTQNLASDDHHGDPNDSSAHVAHALICRHRGPGPLPVRVNVGGLRPLRLTSWRLGRNRPGLPSQGEQMTATTEQISRLLHEAGETHHRVFRIVDGADDDWASWYPDWLINLSELPSLVGTRPVRSELTYLLVSLDQDTPPASPVNPGKRTTPSASSITSIPPNPELVAQGAVQILAGECTLVAVGRAFACRAGRRCHGEHGTGERVKLGGRTLPAGCHLPWEQ